MSHITVIINKTALPPADETATAEPTGVTYVSVNYIPEDSMSDDEVAHKLKQLYKQVRDLGT